MKCEATIGDTISVIIVTFQLKFMKSQIGDTVPHLIGDTEFYLLNPWTVYLASSLSIVQSEDTFRGECKADYCSE